MLQYIDDGDCLTLDGMSIPKDPGNRHYDEALAAVEAGEAEILPAPGPTLNTVAAAKLAAIQAEKCWVRDGGFVVDGVLFDSDQSARISYTELALKLSADPTFTTPWKASAGAWVTMDAPKYVEVSTLGGAHIQAVFAWQAARDAEVLAILAAVAAGTMTEAEARTALEAVSEQFV
jgi:hypothetical protein